MAENVYSELVEPILYYGDNYEHRTGKAIHKRGPLGFPGYNRWPKGRRKADGKPRLEG